MKNNNFELKIFTPNGIKFLHDIDKINFLSSNGFLTILKNHTPIAGLVQEGKCSIWMNNKLKNLYHSKGSFYFINNELKIIVEKCEDKEIKKDNLLLSKDKKIIIGDNEIITNHHHINNTLNKEQELIEFKFKKVIKNINHD